MQVRRFEGGIPYDEEVAEPAPQRFASFLRWLETVPCGCRGEYHDECHEQED